MVGWNVVVPSSLRTALRASLNTRVCSVILINSKYVVYVQLCVLIVKEIINSSFSFIDGSNAYELLFPYSVAG